MKIADFLNKIFHKSEFNEESFGNRDLDLEEKDMIKGIVEMAEKTAKDIMIPRTDVVFIPTDTTNEEILNIIVESGFSRFPVYEETIDNVIGILHVKDVLRMIVSGTPFSIKDLLRKPYFIPDTKKVNALFHEIRRKKCHIAIIVDEYGGVAGIICLEDILEEIVGEIQDEFDDEDDDIIKIGPSTYLCDTRILIEDLNEELGINLPNEDYDTLGGFVFELFGKIPVRYEKKSHNGMNFIIQDVDGNKIKSVKIELSDNKQG